MVSSLFRRPTLLSRHSTSTQVIHHSAPSIKFVKHLNGKLKLCTDTRSLRQFKAMLIVHGLGRDGLLMGEFIRSCFHLGAPCIALSCFERIANVSLPMQNLMLKGLCHHGLYEDLLWVYGRCRKMGCESDGYTFPFVIKACSVLGEFEFGREMHCVVLRHGFGANVVIQTALSNLYAKKGCVKIAEALVDLIPEPDLVCWNALIAGFSLNGFDEEALEVLTKKIWGMGCKPNLSTLASIIPVCTRVGCIEIGCSLHGYAIKSGYLLNGYLAPAFVSMYAKEADLCSARKIFDTVKEKGVGVWNAVIHAYAENMKALEAFNMFSEMLHVKKQPDLVTFLSIIPACQQLSVFGHGECVHAFIVKCGLEQHLSVGTALVSMYAMNRNMDAARFLFDGMPKTNLLLWNSIISGYTQNRHFIESLSMFRGMNSTGVQPDAVSIINILSACSKVEAALLGKSAHAFSLKMGFNTNLNVANVLMVFYTVCGQLDYAFLIFHNMTGKDIVSWNSLISGCLRNGEPDKMEMLVYQMQKEGVEFDFVSLISILSSCNSSEYINRGMSLHCFAIKKGFACDLSSANALLSMYTNCGDLDSSRLVFETMSSRDVVSWNALLTGYCKQKVDNVVLLMFHEMIREGQMPNSITMINLLPSCHKELQGRSIHAWTMKKRILEETSLVTSLISMYTKFNNIKYCFFLFEKGDKWNISLWNAVMYTYVRTENSQKVVDAFRLLLHMGVEPDHITFLSLISAAALLADMNLSHSLLASVVIRGLDRDAATANALINMYAKSGNLSAAEKLFDCLVEKDDVSWNVMVNAHGLHGDAEKALCLLSEMEDSGFTPTSITYLSVLSSCSHSGLVDDAKMVFHSMIRKGITPKVEHFACLVDLLGRAGCLSDALAMIKGSPHPLSASMLKSLLGACYVQTNVEFAEEVCKMCEMDFDTSVPHLMLHHTYAASGRWTDASRVRSELERKSLGKIPGYSLVTPVS